jgi:hypothetical protein
MRSSQPRKVKSLSDSTIRQLNTYALAASAAGVGMLVLTQPAEAEIVYTQAHHVINANQTYKLDINQDGTPDFELKNVFNTFSGNSAGYLQVLPGRMANEVWAAPVHAHDCGSEIVCAAALIRGKSVGPQGAFKAAFPQGEAMAASDAASSNFGSWLNVTNRYLGLKFVVAGQTHYGWARLTVTGTRFMLTATLTGYAYETTPNTPILAGATSGPVAAESSPSAITPDSAPMTLAALALGAPGLSIWRRDESMVAAPVNN